MGLAINPLGILEHVNHLLRPRLARRRPQAPQQHAGHLPLESHLQLTAQQFPDSPPHLSRFCCCSCFAPADNNFPKANINAEVPGPKDPKVVAAKGSQTQRVCAQAANALLFFRRSCGLDRVFHRGKEKGLNGLFILEPWALGHGPVQISLTPLHVHD